jgi:sigma-B regulation protein RsbU (phosphoserine phosphatase)
MIKPMISFKNSIAFRTFVISFILLSVPLLVDSFIILQSRYLESVKNAKKFLLEEGSSRVFQLSRVLQTRKAVMLYVQDSLNLQEKYPIEQTKELDEKLFQVAKSGFFSEVAVLKSVNEGQFNVVGASFPNTPSINIQSFSFYEKIATSKSAKGSFSLLYRTPQEEYYLIFGSSIFDPKKFSSLGMLLFSTDVTASMRELLKSELHDDYQFLFGVLDESMEVVAATDPKLFSQQFLPLSSTGPSTPSATDTETTQNPPMTISYVQGRPFFEFLWQNENQVGVLSLIPNTDFYLLSYTGQNQIEMFPMLDFLEFYAIYAFLLAFGGTIAFLVVKRISRPFTQLSIVMDSLQKGNLQKRYVHDPVGFEINSLGDTFNSTIDTLLQKKHQAEEEHVKSEIYEKELRIGQQVQRSLLTEKMPHVKGVKIAAHYLPAKEVGGDFYDVFERSIDNHDEMVFAVADASGKGVHACFYSLGVRSSLRTFAREYKDLSSVMKSTNQLFCQDTADTGMFVTIVAGVLDPVAKTFSYCSLGHNPPILRHADGSAELLQERTFAAGIVEDMEPKKVSMQLAKGDLIVFYSDGITEAQNGAEELFSDERLIEFIKAKGDLDVEILAEELIAEVKKFENGAAQHDDITLLLIKLERDS